MDLKKKNAVYYFIGFCIPLFIFVILLVPNVIVLYNSGEYASENKIFKNLINNKQCIFGTATGRAKIEQIKLETYKSKKPDIIAFGSSIATQFKDMYFEESFYNMGGIVSNLTKAEELSKRINQIHTPKVVIFTIDFWWFHETSKGLGKKVATYKSKWINDFKNTFLPFNWLWTGKINTKEYLSYLFKKNNCRFGMLAQKKLQGFIHDGSYFHGTRYFDKAKRNFTNDLNNLKISSSHYKHNEDINSNTLKRFDEMVNYWKSKGSKLIIISPPLAPVIFNEIQKNYKTKLNLLNVLINHLVQKNYSYYNLQNPEKLKLSNCEFLDGRHLTEISALKILNFLYENEDLENHVDIEKINLVLNNQNNHIISKKKLQQFFPENKTSDLNDDCSKNSII